MVALAATGMAVAESTSYPAPILYKQANTLILDKEDIKGWPADDPNSDYRQFTGVTVSADGSKVLFSACADYTAIGTDCRPFVVDPDGTGLLDASAVFPPDIKSRSWGWGNMRINDDGSRFFVMAHRYESGVIDERQVYYYDIPGGTAGRAETDGFAPPEAADWFNINSTGSRFYHGKYDNGPAEGFWYTDFGGSKNLIFDVSTLPCDAGTQLCDHLNLAAFLGSSAQGDRTFFSWMSYYLSNGSPDNRSAMWFSDLSGNTQKLTGDDHSWVWSGDWRGVSNSDGTWALYARRHASGDPYQLYVVDVATGGEELVTWTSRTSTPASFMTRSGRYVFVAGESGDAGVHYHTLIDLVSGGERDSWSYHLPTSGNVSNITADDRYYYVTTTQLGSSLYRVDTAPEASADFSQAPNIEAIRFSCPYLLHDESGRVAVSVKVTDSQGAANIESVLLTAIVEGRESPPWPMGRGPLAFPSGDPGSTWLYDDGTHGDETPGDGVFSFDAIATRKGDYEGFNTWYSHFSLPHNVGIRIVAKDKDSNYTIADTELTITDQPFPTVAVKAVDTRAVEQGGDRAKFKITRTGETGSGLLVRYKLLGTAINGVDYQELTGKVRIPAGASSRIISVVPIDDSVPEDRESVKLRIVPKPSYLVGSSGQATVTIQDSAPPVVTVTATDSVAAEPKTNRGAFTVTRTGNTTLPLVVEYKVTGTATNGADYQELSGRIKIPAGAPDQIIRVIPLDDTAVEGKETVRLSILNRPAYEVGRPSGAVVIIKDNDSF
jgi:hypothetical protein